MTANDFTRVAASMGRQPAAVRTNPDCEHRGITARPDPLRSLEQYEMDAHLDLVEMADERLVQEAGRARDRWSWCDHPQDVKWWLERLAAVNAELRRRGLEIAP
jgi:hypothetical protein